jgi:hypothetical protein
VASDPVGTGALPAGAPDRAWALLAAAGLAALESIAVLFALSLRDGAPLGVWVLLVAKLPLCIALLRRSRGACLVLVVWESLEIVVALLNPSLAVPAAILLAASAAACLWFIGLALGELPDAPGSER